MRIYVASSWRNPDQPVVVERLRAAGHHVFDFRQNGDFSWRDVGTSLWGDGPLADPRRWDVARTRAALRHPVARPRFEDDLGGIFWADVVVAVQPFGVSTALELGFARGLGKLAMVLMRGADVDERNLELMLNIADGLCTSVGELVEALFSAFPGSPDGRRPWSQRCSPGGPFLVTRGGRRYVASSIETTDRIALARHDKPLELHQPDVVRLTDAAVSGATVISPVAHSTPRRSRGFDRDKTKPTSCQWCGDRGRTHTRKTVVDEPNALDGRKTTILELCASCRDDFDADEADELELVTVRIDHDDDSQPFETVCVTCEKTVVVRSPFDECPECGYCVGGWDWCGGEPPR